MAEFMKLTKIPVVIYYGDFILDKPSDYPGQDGWRVRLEMARMWRDTVNRHGGDVTVVHLPERTRCRSSARKRSWTNPLQQPSAAQDLELPGSCPITGNCSIIR
jgi:hypothetical protein